MERKLQTEVIHWLKDQGAYVIKTKPGMGTPVGCPDLLALFGPRWMAIEVKAGPKAPFQPGQQYTISLLKNWCPYVYVTYPDNWPLIRDKLLTEFFQSAKG